MKIQALAGSCMAVLGLTFLAGTGAAPADQNWPQWRGPLQSGVAPSADPATSWSETSNIRWKVKIPGEGSATPLIWDNLVFIQAAIATGKKSEESGSGANDQNSSARPESAGGQSPGGPGGGAGGRRGGFGGGPRPTETYQFVLLCFDRSTGKVLW